MATKPMALNFAESSVRPLPRRIIGLRHTLVLIAYAVHVFTPVVHSLTAHEECHVGCPHAAAKGSSLWSPCGPTPCDNPHHHHHGSHDADHCIVCQSAPTDHTPVSLVSFSVAHAPEPGCAILFAFARPHSHGLCSHQIRGPPFVAVS